MNPSPSSPRTRRLLLGLLVLLAGAVAGALGSATGAAAQVPPECPPVAVYYPPTTLPPGCEVDDDGTVVPAPTGPTGPDANGLLGDDDAARGAAGQGDGRAADKGAGAGAGALAKTGPMDVLRVLQWAVLLLGLGALASYEARRRTVPTS